MKKPVFAKIESIKKLQQLGLPVPEIIFIFDFKKQEKQIDGFLIGKKFVSIRSDKKGKTDFCPHWLHCPRAKAKGFIKKVLGQGYAVLLQGYVPIWEKRIVQGNILTLKRCILMELMGAGPLVWLNRNGEIRERIKFNKKTGREIFHSGQRLAKSEKLAQIAKLAGAVPPYNILEFTLRKPGITFWQIRRDPGARKLDR